ncbi:MAG: hypothetical protein GY851_26475 [bacterium]|nr:hypothetical protein [bacterium]
MAKTDKTLVAWATLDNTTQRGGSVLTIQSGTTFDAIVFGERKTGAWMAGSNGFTRTEKTQDGSPAETADSNTQVQMAIVYEGKEIRIYRNGDLYASYEAANIDLLTAKDAMAVFGLRHVGAGPGQRISGSIEDARIYARALTPDEINALVPNKESDIPAYAWWDFEGTAAEKTGRFPHSLLEGGAKVEGGRLVLDNDSVLAATQTRDAVKKADVTFVPHTPAMPEDVPDTWLTYHQAHPGPDTAIPADPNCAIHYKGRYHLHYIYNNKGPAFAHLSSTDMVHWTWHPTVLAPAQVGHGMFSGTAFLTKEGIPAIIYHGQGSDRNQIAFALDDDLDEWSKTVVIEPRTASGEAPDMRHWDPDCWLAGDTYYAIAGGQNPKLMRSDDLKTWTYLGDLYHPDFPNDLGVAKDEDTSCANMFKIGDKWMLLCISHGLGARYYLGDFKDEQYLPDHHVMLNWAGWDCFAPESLLTPDGRRVMWAWCTPWVNDMQRVKRSKDFPALMDWKIQPGIQSLPRELSLPEDGVLRIKPLRELEQLRTNPKQEESIAVESDTAYVLQEIAGDTIELEVTFAASKAKEFGVNILCGQDGKGGFTIASGAKAKTLTVGYANPPFELKDGEDLTLRVFIDKSMIEVFANDRQAAVAWHEYDPKDLHVSLFCNGGTVTVKQVRAWKMKSVYSGR